jgi:hypothetical protein
MIPSFKLSSAFLLIMMCAGTGISQTSHPEPKTLEIGSKAPDFNLAGVDGKMYDLKKFDKTSVLVIIFSCNHCPTAQAYEDRIIALANDYKSKDMKSLKVCSYFTSYADLSHP